MERAEYQRLAALDRRLWWFRGMHAQMLGALGRRRPPRKGERILDAGCGTGGFLAGLGERFPETEPLGVEIDAAAGTVAREHSRRPRKVSIRREILRALLRENGGAVAVELLLRRSILCAWPLSIPCPGALAPARLLPDILPRGTAAQARAAATDRGA